MKNKYKKIYLVPLIVVLMVLSTFIILHPQTISTQSPPIIFNVSSQTPAVLNVIGSGTLIYQLTWNVTGTLSACSIRVDSSVDAITWNVGDVISAQTCTSNGTAISVQRPVNYIRINPNSTITGSGSLTTIVTGYLNSPNGLPTITVLGVPLVGGSSTGVYSPLWVDASQFTGSDMCTKIQVAIASTNSSSAVIDARGFSGVQFCGAAIAPIMFWGGGTIYSAVPDTLLLGKVTLVIDGPANNLYYTDTVGSTYGTPPILIPSQFAVVGSNFNSTTFTICTGPGTPIANCTHAFPQRLLGTVSSTSLTGNTLTVNETGVTLTASTNVWQGELVQLVGLSTANNNVTRVVASVASSSSITIAMPTTTTNCAATCGGSIYAFTPIVAFAPGVGGGPYIPIQSVSGVQGFGQKFQHISINEQGNQADASLFTGYGVTGFQNVNGGDLSEVWDDEHHFNTGICFDLGPGSTDAHYIDLRCTNFGDNHAVPSSVGIYHAAADWGINGYAIVGSNTQTPNACIMVDGIPGAFVGTTYLTGGHAESCVDNIEVGPSVAVRSLHVDSFIGSPSGAHNSTNVINILSDGGNCQGCSFQNITRQSGGATNTFVDGVNSITITDLALGIYLIDANGACSYTNAFSITGTCQGLLANGSIAQYNGVNLLTTKTTLVPVTVSNPTAATDTIMMAVPLGANYFNNVSQVYHIIASGVLTTTAASVPAITITPKICSVAGCGSGTVTPLAAIQSSALNTTAITNATWKEDLDLVVVATGASCNFLVKGVLIIDTSATVTQTPNSIFTDSNTAVTSPNQICTNALFLDFFVQQSTTGASNSYKQLQGIIK